MKKLLKIVIVLSIKACDLSIAACDKVLEIRDSRKPAIWRN